MIYHGSLLCITFLRKGSRRKTEVTDPSGELLFHPQEWRDDPEHCKDRVARFQALKDDGWIAIATLPVGEKPADWAV